MNALVLYDSRYGNTERIAETIALAVQEAMPTRLASIDEIDACEEALSDVDLLVIGGPTHRHGISDPLKDALSCLGERALDGIKVAVFDTRAHGARVVTGSAAVRIGRLLRRHGAWLVVPPASFIVDATTGPLQRGEVDHARKWAGEVLLAIGVRPRPSQVPAGR
jgi:menaquinone-dependent protoporphyrinogen IX oxidase